MPVVHKNRAAKQMVLKGIEVELYKTRLLDCKTELIARLESEGGEEFARHLRNCGEEIRLACTDCFETREVRAACKKRYCPVCQPRLSAERKRELEPIVNAMQWPLFVTLTSTNTPSPKHVREIMRALVKLRRKKIWTRHVKGGVAALEVTNIGNGWHLHLHMVIDCEWLAVRTDPPPKSATREEKEARCKSAQRELSREWAKCIKQEGNAVVWVKRASSSGILDEVLKYSIKGGELARVKGRACDLIEAITACRLMTTFGKAYKRPPKEKGEGCKCPSCGGIGTTLPAQLIVGGLITKSREGRGAQHARRDGWKWDHAAQSR